MAITNEMRASVLELYTAYFNRAADKAGVDYWTNEMDVNGWTADDVAKSFAEQEEYTAIYDGLTNAQVVAQVYTNTLGRDADTAGAAYWEGELDAGTIGVNQLIQAVIAAAKEDVDGLGDDAVVANKTAVSQHAYDKNLTEAQARTISLENVTKDPSSMDAVNDAIDAANIDGETFVLTKDVTTIAGTAKNDLITGTTNELTSDHRIIDSSTSDNDVFNLTAYKAPGAMNVTNVENINVDWQAFGKATLDLDNVIGATVTLSSDKQGYLGNAAITNADRNDITLGDGIVGTVTIAGAEDSTINAGEAKSISLTAADRDITLNADNSETVSVAGTVDNLTLAAQNATTVTVDAARSADITLGKDADVKITGTNADYTLQSAADVELEVLTGSTFKTITVAGDNAVTLNFADTIDGKEITTAGTVVEKTTIAGNVDYSDINASEIVIDAAGTVGVADIKTNTGANFTANKDLTAGGIQTFVLDDDSSSDEITLTLKTTTTKALNFVKTASSNEFETVNIIGAAKEVTGVDLTIADITAGTNKVVLSSEVNDIIVSAITAGEVDASAVAGDLTLTASTTDSMLVVGGEAKNTVTFSGVIADDKEATFVGNATSNAVDIIDFSAAINTTGSVVAQVYGGDDKVTADLLTTGSMAVIANGGNNTISAKALTSGTLTVIAGAGKDTVTVGAATTLNKATVSLELGDGDNTVNLFNGGTAGSETTVVTGSGNDTVNLTGKALADEITLNLGDGTDTLVINDDISAAKITATGLDVIDFGAAAAATVNASLLDGQSYDIKATKAAANTDELIVVIDGTDTDVDFSGLGISNTVGTSVVGLNITAKDGFANTIKGSAGDDEIVAGTGKDTIVFAATAALNGEDDIALFATGTDKIDISAMTTSTTFDSLPTAAGDAVDNGAYFLTVADLDVADDADAAETAIAAALTASGGSFNNFDGTATFVITTADKGTHMYSWTEGATTTDGTVDAAELTLVGIISDAVLGTVEGTVATTDFILA